MKTLLHNKDDIKHAVLSGAEVFWRSKHSRVVKTGTRLKVRSRLSNTRYNLTYLDLVIKKYGYEGFYAITEVTNGQ